MRENLRIRSIPSSCTIPNLLKLQGGRVRTTQGVKESLIDIKGDKRLKPVVTSGNTLGKHAAVIGRSVFSMLTRALHSVPVGSVPDRVGNGDTIWVFDARCTVEVCLGDVEVGELVNGGAEVAVGAGVGNANCLDGS